MVVSQRRIDANRANAQKSTGPRTPEGKLRAARNRIVHGLCSRSPVVPGEDPKEYERYLRATFDELDPRGQAQEEMATKFAAASWKLRRVDPAEARIFAGTHGITREPGKLRDPAGMLVSMANMHDSDGKPNSPVLVLDRYAHGLERSRNAALCLLFAMQKKQKEEDRVEAARYPDLREEDEGGEEMTEEQSEGTGQGETEFAVEPVDGASETDRSCARSEAGQTEAPGIRVIAFSSDSGVGADRDVPTSSVARGAAPVARDAARIARETAPDAQEVAMSGRVLETPHNAPLRFEPILAGAPLCAQTAAVSSVAAEMPSKSDGAGPTDRTHSAPTTPVSELKAMTRMELEKGAADRES